MKKLCYLIVLFVSVFTSCTLSACSSNASTDSTQEAEPKIVERAAPGYTYRYMEVLCTDGAYLRTFDSDKGFFLLQKGDTVMVKEGRIEEVRFNRDTQEI